MRDQCQHIRQSVSTESLFTVISGWCRDGAGQRDRSIQVLSAFVSGGGVRALAPLLDVFLADGNRVEIVFGIDRNGTDREAVAQLASLRTEYPGQATVFLFNAPSHTSIFHPKLFLYKYGRVLRQAVVGSANLTLGGLGHNLESLLHYTQLKPGSGVARELLAIWNLFRSPNAPLRREFLKRLTPALAKQLINRLPRPEQTESRRAKGKIASLWSPLSRVPLPRSNAPPRLATRRRSVGTRTASRFLLMDVLQETRRTQMQVPLPVVEGFFGVSRTDSALFQISILGESRLSQPIERPLVATGSMRRIEMPTIAGLDRPLVVYFERLGARSFAYRLIPRHERDYERISTVLDSFGQQGAHRRRFVIATRRDPVWLRVQKIMNL